MTDRGFVQSKEKAGVTFSPSFLYHPAASVSHNSKGAIQPRVIRVKNVLCIIFPNTYFKKENKFTVWRGGGGRINNLSFRFLNKSAESKTVCLSWRKNKSREGLCKLSGEKFRRERWLTPLPAESGLWFVGLRTSMRSCPSFQGGL